MVDPETGSPWARKGAKKKIVTGRNIDYSNPKATPHWFDTAKEKYGKTWIKRGERNCRRRKVINQSNMMLTDMTS